MPSHPGRNPPKVGSPAGSWPIRRRIATEAPRQDRSAETTMFVSRPATSMGCVRRYLAFALPPTRLRRMSPRSSPRADSAEETRTGQGVLPVKAWQEGRLQGCTNDNLLAFVLVLRYSGLRIGDASMLTLAVSQRRGVEAAARRLGTSHEFMTNFWEQPGKILIQKTGGEGGIRTHGTRKGSTVFETARFNHSRTSPYFQST